MRRPLIVDQSTRAFHRLRRSDFLCARRAWRSPTEKNKTDKDEREAARARQAAAEAEDEAAMAAEMAAEMDDEGPATAAAALRRTVSEDLPPFNQVTIKWGTFGIFKCMQINTPVRACRPLPPADLIGRAVQPARPHCVFPPGRAWSPYSTATV